MFRTVSVTLINKIQRMVDGQPVYDDADRPIFDTSEKTVSGVLVGMMEFGRAKTGAEKGAVLRVI